MIKNLSGVYETVEYENQRFVMLYDNDEIEEYPTHWHNAVEVIIPLHNGFTVVSGGVEYHLSEKEIIVIPPGELHSMPAQDGRRIIFQCDNSVISEVPSLESILPVFSSAVHITPSLNKELYVLARKNILDIYTEYYSKAPMADVRIYMYLITILTAIREFQLSNADENAAAAGENTDESRKFGLVTKYINQNYMYELPLEKLASTANTTSHAYSRSTTICPTSSTSTARGSRRQRGSWQIRPFPSRKWLCSAVFPALQHLTEHSEKPKDALRQNSASSSRSMTEPYSF